MTSDTVSHIGILHPGEMGSFIAHCAVASGRNVYWCSAGRSSASRKRATDLHLHESSSLEALCASCEVLISVCPPHAAAEQACAVIDAGFKGIYCDANALAPSTVQSIGAQMEAAGISFVDGGIIGLPTYKDGDTWLYLCGKQAASVAACFSKGPLETRVLGPVIGQASALKMCFAAWNKGKNAMLTAILAAAEDMGVRAALEQQWDIFEPGFSQAATTRLRNIARKSWRFGAEMDEIAETLDSCGVPPEFFVGAAELYRRESSFKDCTAAPELEEILAAVRKPGT